MSSEVALLRGIWGGGKGGGVDGATLLLNRLSGATGADADGSQHSKEGRGGYGSSLLAKIIFASCLRHHALSAADLTLDLFAGPASSLNGAGLELAVLARLLDHGGQPIRTEGFNQLAIRISIGKITGWLLARAAFE